MDPYLTLVNKTHPLPKDWLDGIELVTARNILNEAYRLEKETMAQYCALRDRMLEEGIQIDVESAYRSVGEQEALWAEYEKAYGVEYCQNYVAVPGYSEHHMGLAIDICFIQNGKVMGDETPGKDAFFARLHTIMPEYGFILRYLPGKETITGYACEPWHLRYVGVQAARLIMARRISLEEYLLL